MAVNMKFAVFQDVW